ncbi:diguanylate cyclase [Kosakonia pseudosacchari]|uniref:diguanylate cyclase n=1 Tax=Kosakonia pseudosacchari TaxID=1646340 RepID=A0ABX4IWV7_9ENTR|nr:diguanylate cyclase [Kosakonia pseudosacchari]PDO90201.1 diguanylate cyclase [Kosakonia pseudosacchari]
MYRSTEQIDNILFDLNKAVDAHYDWLINMFACVVNNNIEQSESINVNSHHLCHFGRWLDGHQSMDQEESNCLQAIEATHTKMHHCGRELMWVIRDKKTNTDKFSEFKHRLTLFSAAVTAYKIYLLKMRSSVDILTGLPSRRMLDERFEQQLKDVSDQNMYMLLLDIDRFKNVNDTYGHLVGDAVLRELAQQLRDRIRGGDTAYRYGGEEFIIILYAPSDREACQAALRLCKSVAATTIHCDDKALNITVTIGVTQAWAGESIGVVVKRADAAMYRGKQTGRNRCMLMDEGGEIHLITS